MSELTRLEIHYPGEATTSITSIEPIDGTLEANKEVVLAIHIEWDHAGVPETPVPAIVAEFLLDDPASLFPEHANRTAVYLADHGAKVMTLHARHIFQVAGDYFVRVTFGGHNDVLPAEFKDADGSRKKITVTKREQ